MDLRGHMDDCATSFVRDQLEQWPVSARTIEGRGRVMNFVEDVITTPTGDTITRQWCTHPGAVAVIAWRDDDHIMVVDQYRHPVGMRLIEPPAGLLDIAGEDYLLAAQRELAEEAEIAAQTWNVLVDVFTTPGGVQESIRVFLARDITQADRPDGFIIEGEEADMGHTWVPRQTLVDGILAGHLSSPSLVAGVMALEIARLAGTVDQLRPANSPWPARQAKAARDETFADGHV